jgi:pimeloyl-ACP methyl ester carboxylesterase
VNSLLLLHGALGASDQLESIAKKLGAGASVMKPGFSGHGGRPVPDTFSIERFARDVLEWMEEREVAVVDLFGYSMGGYVALYLARHHPEKVGKIFTLATKFSWTPETAAQEVRMLDAGKILQKVPEFARTLENRHAPQDWKLVLERTAAMMTALGNKPALSAEDFSAITQSVTLAVGDRDKMVSIGETATVYGQLPAASFLVLPGTPHPIESVNEDALCFHLSRFFGTRSR